MNKNYIAQTNEDSIVIHNDFDRFNNLLNSTNCDTFETIIAEYINRFGDTISADQCCQVIESLSKILYPKIARLNFVKRTAKEHATYIKKYLAGEMYTSEDAFIEYRDVQQRNAQTIIDVCNEKEG